MLLEQGGTLRTEFERVGFVKSVKNRDRLLHDQAKKIVKNCGHNFELMEIKLLAFTKHHSDAHGAVHAFYLKAVFQELNLDKHIVGEHVRGNPNSNTESDRASASTRDSANKLSPAGSVPNEDGSGQRVNAQPGQRRNAAPSSPRRPRRPPVTEAAIQAGQKVIAKSLLHTTKMADGRVWAEAEYCEGRTSIRESKIWQAIYANVAEPANQFDRLGTLPGLTNSLFSKLLHAAAA